MSDLANRTLSLVCHGPTFVPAHVSKAIAKYAVGKALGLLVQGLERICEVRSRVWHRVCCRLNEHGNMLDVNPDCLSTSLLIFWRMTMKTMIKDLCITVELDRKALEAVRGVVAFIGLLSKSSHTRLRASRRRRTVGFSVTTDGSTRGTPPSRVLPSNDKTVGRTLAASAARGPNAVSSFSPAETAPLG